MPHRYENYYQTQEEVTPEEPAKIIKVVGDSIVYDLQTLTIDVSRPLSLQVIYSLMKRHWRASEALTKYMFPILALTPYEFEFVYGRWTFTERAKRNFRAAKWRTEFETDYLDQPAGHEYTPWEYSPDTARLLKLLDAELDSYRDMVDYEKCEDIKDDPRQRIEI